MNLKRFEILLPLNYNDGRPIEREKFLLTQRELVRQFGATTVDTTRASGTWVYGGTLYQDLLIRVTVDSSDCGSKAWGIAMVKEALVESKVDAGRRLTKSLEKAKLRVAASLWFFDAESNRWQLVIASPAVDQEGPAGVYRRILHILDGDPTLSDSIAFTDIHVSGPNDQPVKALRNEFKGTHDLRITDSRVGDEFVEDAFIYQAR